MAIEKNIRAVVLVVSQSLLKYFAVEMHKNGLTAATSYPEF